MTVSSLSQLLLLLLYGLLVGVLTLMIHDTINSKKVYHKKDFPNSIFFNKKDEEEFSEVSSLMTFLNELTKKGLSNREMIETIDRWLMHYTRASVSFYLINLMKGDTVLPSDQDLKPYLSESDRELLSERSKINDVLRYIVEINLNQKD